jgi:hypothetical protein
MLLTEVAALSSGAADGNSNICRTWDSLCMNSIAYKVEKAFLAPRVILLYLHALPIASKRPIAYV